MPRGFAAAGVLADGAPARAAAVPRGCAAAGVAADCAVAVTGASPAEAAGALPRAPPRRCGRVAGSEASTPSSAFFAFAGFFFGLSGFSAMRFECTVPGGTRRTLTEQAVTRPSICAVASYAVVSAH